ncbi:AI-2E family transporter [Myxococcota bacterium]|nr:AI-2E family transporter [Myxococcota bacterium]MBU1379455.1 AI-2E family transporter [Myxococcota bacterium]MBU1496158.1 AI-2E family transporter [Myxococcota bacterium]
MGKQFGFGSSSRSHFYFQIAIILVFSWLVFSLLAILKPLVVPLVIAFFLAYFLNPFVSWLEKYRIPRTIGIVILLALFVLIVTIFVIFIVPLLAKQLREFIAKIPEYSNRVKTWAVPWIETTFKTKLPNLREATNLITDRISKDLMAIAGQAYSPLKEVATFAMAGTYFIISAVTTLFVIPFFTFFLLRDFEKVSHLPEKLVPPRHSQSFHKLTEDLDETMSRWLRGQMIVMFTLGVLYSIGYSMVGITLSLFIGMLTGFLAFIPYVGAFLGFLFALLIAALDGGVSTVLWVCVVFGIVQTMDAFFITPNVLGKSVGLNPAIVVIALMGFGLIWGFWGALIAVPFAGVLNVVIKHIFEMYKTSDFFNRKTPV